MTRGKAAQAGIFTVVLAFTGALVAHAADGPGGAHHSDCASASHDTVACTFSDSGPGGPGTTGQLTLDGQPQNQWQVEPDRVYTWELSNEGGRPCWIGTSHPVSDPGERARQQRAADSAYQAQSGGADYPQCPSQGAPTGTSGDTPSAATPPFIRNAAVRQQLGSPAPRIQPGRAIAGKVAFLEIGGAGPRSFDLADPLGGPGAHVDARPTYRVDWGDGTVIETSSNGGPWPDGDVTHVYQRSGHYDVIVTARWTAQWSGANGERGDLNGLTTEGRISRFPVTEVQAVRQR
jgi:hypothetical protein